MASLFDNSNFQLLDKVAGKPTISVTGNGVGFSKQLLSKLEYSHYVQIFINKSDRQIGIRKCEKSDSGSLKFVPENKEKVDSLRWYNADFTETLRNLVDSELSNISFVCEGELLRDEDIPSLLFDFTKARPLKE